MNFNETCLGAVLKKWKDYMSRTNIYQAVLIFPVLLLAFLITIVISLFIDFVIGVRDIFIES